MVTLILLLPDTLPAFSDIADMPLCRRRYDSCRYASYAMPRRHHTGIPLLDYLLIISLGC